MFPVYEMDEYAEVLAGVPFIRAGWTDERAHELDDLRRGEWMLLALCLGADGPGGLARHDALARDAGVRAADLARLPPDGLDRRDLHARLDGTPWAAAAEFADWLTGDTGTCFLDFTDEFDIVDNDAWDPDYLADPGGAVAAGRGDPGADRRAVRAAGSGPRRALRGARRRRATPRARPDGPPMPDAASALVAPTLPSQRSLGLALRRSPPLPSALARSLRGGAGAGEFRAIVDLVFPTDAAALMAADQPPLNRAASRVDAFLFRVAHELFAVYEPNFDDGYWDGAEYDQVTRGIPFVRFGWTLEERHELDARPRLPPPDDPLRQPRRRRSHHGLVAGRRRG